MSTSDVVVVGGGIEGAAPAYGLAQNGLGVTVLEASKEFPDRVRGESMHLWGLVEARRSGAKDALLAAGAHVAPLWMQHVEGVGADGRASTIRRQSGIQPHRQEPINYIAGSLVDEPEGVPADYDVLGPGVVIPAAPVPQRHLASTTDRVRLRHGRTRVRWPLWRPSRSTRSTRSTTTGSRRSTT